MAKTDVLDRSRAAAYAWRRFTPGEDVAELLDAPEAAPFEDADEGDASAEEASMFVVDADEAQRDATTFRDEARARASALAEGVARAWFLPEAEQAEAIAVLTQRADEMGMLSVAMEDHPLESVRLFRLALRHWTRLSQEARDAARHSLAWSDLSHPEVVDLFAEAVLLDDRALHGSMMIALSLRDDTEEALARAPSAGARFARLLDEAVSSSSRRTAIFLVGIAGRADAALSLRRALRPPHYNLRWRALACLDEDFPDAIDASDLLFLLEEAVAHAPPWIHGDEENSRAHCYFPDLLDRVIARLRPDGAAALLGRLVEGDCDVAFWGRPSLDAEWALGVLAATFPEEARPRIDARLRGVEAKPRKLAVAAAGRLPDALAWPRLLAGAADPVPVIAALAQSLWLERRGTLCRFDELAGVESALLSGPPSERMRSRLGVLRSGPLEARAAMAEVLLGEAPDPEALVLLLFAMGDPALWNKKHRPLLPESCQGYASVVIQRFGERGAFGLVALAERYTDGDNVGFFHEIAHLFGGKIAIPTAIYPALRALALQGIEMRSPYRIYDALTVLGRVGAPAASAPRLAALAWSPDSMSFLPGVASSALTAAAPGDADVDALILAELEAAFDEVDLARFARAIPAGIRRRLVPAIAMAERLIARYALEPQDDTAITDALQTCDEELDAIDRGPAVCSGAALTSPGTHAFALACRRLYVRMTKAPLELRQLRAALRGHPVAAAEAAHALLRWRLMKVTDRRLPGIVRRAPLDLRAWLLSALILDDAPPRISWPLIAEILVSTDPRVTHAFRHRIHWLAEAGLGKELCAIEAQIIDPTLRDELAEWRSLDEKPTLYWQDEIEDEEVEAEEAGEERNLEPRA